MLAQASGLIPQALGMYVSPGIQLALLLLLVLSMARGVKSDADLKEFRTFR